MKLPSHRSRTLPTFALLMLGLAPAGKAWLNWVALPAFGAETACVMALLETWGGPASLDPQGGSVDSETPVRQPELAILTRSRQ